MAGGHLIQKSPDNYEKKLIVLYSKNLELMQILYALEKCGILITKFTRYTSKIVRNSLLVLYAENH